MDYYQNYYCEIASTPTEYIEGLTYRYELSKLDITTDKGPNKPDVSNPKKVYDPWVNCFCTVTVISIGGVFSFIFMWILHHFKSLGVKAYMGPKD